MEAAAPDRARPVGRFPGSKVGNVAPNRCAATAAVFKTPARGRPMDGERAPADRRKSPPVKLKVGRGGGGLNRISRARDMQIQY